VALVAVEFGPLFVRISPPAKVSVEFVPAAPLISGKLIAVDSPSSITPLFATMVVLFGTTLVAVTPVPRLNVNVPGPFLMSLGP